MEVTKQSSLLILGGWNSFIDIEPRFLEDFHSWWVLILRVFTFNTSKFHVSHHRNLSSSGLQL